MKAICVDVGGTTIKYGWLEKDENDKIKIIEYNKKNWDAKQVTGVGIPQLIFDLIKDWISEEIAFLGISTAGVVDSQSGKILHANDNIPDYTNLQLADRLEKLSGLTVAVENDVNCVALAEFAQGNALRQSSTLFLTVGTGVGGAYISGGEVLKGYNNAALEVGYLPLGDSSFEEKASTTSLVKRCQTRLNKKDLDGEKIFSMALKDNNLVCIEEIDRFISYLTDGIYFVCQILDPECVVLGGGIMEQADYLIPKIDNQLNKKTMNPVKITRAFYSNNAGLIGAYYNGLHSFDI